MGIDGRPPSPGTGDALWPFRPRLGSDAPASEPVGAGCPPTAEEAKETEIEAFRSTLYAAFTAARSAGLGMDYAARYAARRAQRAEAALTISEMLAQLRGLAPLG
jgi:hypothetical protein